MYLFSYHGMKRQPKTTHVATTSSTASSAFSTFFTSVWHSRLGHPGNEILDFLHSSRSIKCNKDRSFVCHSCPLGKHVRLYFISSMSQCTRPFEIIHSDLWTSPISSPSGYKYYVLFLDHYTNLLWTFLLFRKFQVYDFFVNFTNYVTTQFELPIKSIKCDHGVNLSI